MEQMFYFTFFWPAGPLGGRAKDRGKEARRDKQNPTHNVSRAFLARCFGGRRRPRHLTLALALGPTCEQNRAVVSIVSRGREGHGAHPNEAIRQILPTVLQETEGKLAKSAGEGQGPAPSTGAEENAGGCRPWRLIGLGRSPHLDCPLRPRLLSLAGRGPEAFPCGGCRRRALPFPGGGVCARPSCLIGLSHYNFGA